MKTSRKTVEEAEQIAEERDGGLQNTDIVYFCRGGDNEELKYSLRSVEKNFPHRKVWIYGEKPEWCHPDEFVYISQERRNQNTKWDRVRAMFRQVCINPEITENFVLFNDDFYVMQPIEELPPYYRCPLCEYIVRLELLHQNTPSEYSMLLRRAFQVLDGAKLPTNSYELHIPMMFNKHKLLEVLGAFPEHKATRSLYANYNRLDGVQHDDVKVYQKDMEFDRSSDYLSSEDGVFDGTEFGEFIREKFPEESKFEKVGEE